METTSDKNLIATHWKIVSWRFLWRDSFKRAFDRAASRNRRTQMKEMKGMKEEAMEAAAVIALAFSLVNSLLGLGRVSRRHAR